MTTAEIAVIAETIARAPHCPDHPAWAAYLDETCRMFLTIPVRVEWDTAPVSRYANVQELFHDIERGVMYTNAVNPVMPIDHPAQRFGRLVHGFPLGIRLNSIARAVHDYFGHYLTGADFSFDGEVTAYKAQCALHSAAARPVLFADNIGQLCYYHHFGSFMPEQRAFVMEEVFV